MAACDSFDSKDMCCFDLTGKITQFSGLSQNSPACSRAAASGARVWKTAASQKEAVTSNVGPCFITVPDPVCPESLAFSALIFSMAK